MLYEPLEHERRSRQVADSLRNYLIGVNTGGIATVLAIAAKLMDSELESPRWALWPLLLFVAALACVGISMFLAKDRELDRRDEAFSQDIQPGKAKKGVGISKLRRSYTWDLVTAMLFLFGVFSVICLAPIP